MSYFEKHNIINQPWPEADLEYLGSCPLCGSLRRTLLYEGLRDRVFFCAPGSWTLHRCDGCNCAYLDPRPIPESMGRAYEQYFTHETEDQKALANLLKRVKQAVKNGYFNWKWETSLAPALKILGMLLPKSKRAVLDEGVMRHLPRPSGERALLDVGCGNGQFLSLAFSAGWRVTGFDLDPKAVNNARSRGIDVRLGGFETLPQASDCFDAITVCHVIEHVYNPKELLANCYRLLKPGGYFWIETPNISSFGHMHFKDSWLDLDPPRHLNIQTWQLLQQMLFEAGFRNITPAAWRPEYENRYYASKAIKCGRNPMKRKPTLMGMIMGRFVEFGNRVDHTRREFITLQATK